MRVSVVVTVAALALGACGGGDDDKAKPTGSTGTTVNGADQTNAIACRQMRNANADTFLIAARSASVASDQELREAGTAAVDAFNRQDATGVEALGVRLGKACKRLGL